MLIQLRKNVALLWIFRILAVPVVLVLFAAGFILNLLYGVVGAVGGLISLLGGAAAVLALLDGCYGAASPPRRATLWQSRWGSSSFCRRCIPDQPDCAAAVGYVGGQSPDLRRVRAVHLPL